MCQASCRGCGEDELRGGVGAVMAKGEMVSVEADKEVREDKDCYQEDSGEDDDEEKVRFIGWKLLDVHDDWMRGLTGASRYILGSLISSAS